MRRLLQHVHMWRPRELHGPIACGYQGGNLGRRRYECRCGAERWAQDFERQGDRVYPEPVPCAIEDLLTDVEVRGD